MARKPEVMACLELIVDNVSWRCARSVMSYETAHFVRKTWLKYTWSDRLASNSSDSSNNETFIFNFITLHLAAPSDRIFDAQNDVILLRNWRKLTTHHMYSCSETVTRVYVESGNPCLLFTSWVLYWLNYAPSSGWHRITTWMSVSRWNWWYRLTVRK